MWKNPQKLSRQIKTSFKKVINIPCACFERVYIVKVASHRIKSRFNEIPVNI